jgi:hypothetical protein
MDVLANKAVPLTSCVIDDTWKVVCSTRCINHSLVGISWKRLNIIQLREGCGLYSVAWVIWMKMIKNTGNGTTWTKLQWATQSWHVSLAWHYGGCGLLHATPRYSEHLIARLKKLPPKFDMFCCYSFCSSKILPSPNWPFSWAKS